jgi:hypothetical protein
MTLIHHTALSVIISGILYAIFKSWSLAVSCLISGIFIDIDHFIDYIREYGWQIKIKKFFYVFENKQFNQLLLILHGWEWLLLGIVVAWVSDWNPWITGALIGFTQHILFDQLSNSCSFKDYFLLWRWKNKFNASIVCNKKE